MKQQFISIGLSATILLLGVTLSWAAENTADAPHTATGKAKAQSQTVHHDTHAKRKVANIKLVNINGDTREQLKKLPGIGNAEADKIIAGRPYPSKANLVTQNILPRGIYENIKGLIIAKQPYKDGAKNAAIYSKKK